MHFLLLSGSFHRHSRSQALLTAMVPLLAGHTTSSFALDQLPFYSPDLAGEHRPPVVLAWFAAVESADAIVVCTPEYNHSIPAVLKNGIDWVSRPAFNSPLKDKPVCLVTQAVTPVGGARAQAHLKLVFDSTLSLIHPAHEMMVHGVDKALDANLDLVDDKVRVRLARHLEDFVRFVELTKTLKVSRS